MSRYKDLTKSKREFLEELLELDDEHNFLTGPEFAEFAEIIRERRYKTEDSEWINKIIQNRKAEYKRYKKQK